MKQEEVNKIKIIRELYLNYIKQINFLVSDEWTEESEQDYLSLFELYSTYQFLIFWVSEQKKVNKVQTLRTIQNYPVYFHSILFTKKH